MGTQNTFTMRLPAELCSWLDELAAREGRSRTKQIEHLLTTAMRRRQQGEAKRTPAQAGG